MKTLSDGTAVNDRGYYYLLDFKDRDTTEFLYQKFGKTRLNELTLPEYRELFKAVTTEDFRNLK